MFWDRVILPGKTWSGVIESELQNARCVLVVWSSHSIDSDWVLEEAEQGKKRKILIPTTLERISPPFGFTRFQAADLSDWNGQERDPAFASLLSSLHNLLGSTRSTKPSEATDRNPKPPSSIFNPIEYNAEYILIPGGSFTYSVTKQQTEIPSLYVAKHLVTNKQYHRFVGFLKGEKVLREPDIIGLSDFTEILKRKVESDEGMMDFLGKDEGVLAEKIQSRSARDHRFIADNQPVVGVPWFCAVAYCHWLTELSKRIDQGGGYLYRLPKEEEWEWAAGGGERTYPWGEEEPDTARANYDERIGKTTPVGTYPKGTTPEGLMDMAGNVREWTKSRFDPIRYGRSRALRGGSWGDNPEDLRCNARFHFNPGQGDGHIGFRVVCVALPKSGS